MARQIIEEDIISAFWNKMKRNAWFSDKEIHGTDFKDSWITK